jgi:glycosyltransferase 2 family protein
LDALLKRWTPGRALRIVIAIALTALALFWKTNPAAVARTVAHADLAWIALAVLLAVFDRVLMAYRWLVLLCPLDAEGRPPFRAVMRIFFTSTFVGTFLPTGGGDLVRAYGLSQLNVPAGTAFASVLMDRLLGVLSIVIVGIVGLLLAPTRDLASNRTIELSLAVTGAVCAVGALVVFSESVAGLTQRVTDRLPFARLRRMAGEVTQATRAYARYHGELANVLAGSVGVQVLRVLQAYCLGRALSIGAPLAVYFALVPLILLVILLPVSINGIGTTQVMFVWFFARAATPQAEAFALSVLFLALGVIGNLPGGFLYASSRPATPV